MLSKSKIQLLRSLRNKKSRIESGIFVVEWKKNILEFLHSDMDIVEWFFTQKFADAYNDLFNIDFTVVTTAEMDRIAMQVSNDAGVLLVRIPQNVLLPHVDSKWILMLDAINDPWNLGTIIRLADWYGIDEIICSPDTVDCHNPKVVSATMGSLTRVSVFYQDLVEYISWQDNPTIYGALLDGENIHTKTISSQWGYILIGNESHGISSQLKWYITDAITIPRFGFAESLNAWVAAGIIVDRIVSG